MISLRDLASYQYGSDPIRITCIDGQVIVGMPGEVDDEEESGLGEPGISVYLPDGGWVGVGLSEISRISVLTKKDIARVHPFPSQLAAAEA